MTGRIYVLCDVADFVAVRDEFASPSRFTSLRASQACWSASYRPRMTAGPTRPGGPHSRTAPRPGCRRVQFLHAEHPSSHRRAARLRFQIGSPNPSPYEAPHSTSIVPYHPARSAWDQPRRVPVLVHHLHPVSDPQVLRDALQVLPAVLMHPRMQGQQRIRADRRNWANASMTPAAPCGSRRCSRCEPTTNVSGPTPRLPQRRPVLRGLPHIQVNGVRQ